MEVAEEVISLSSAVGRKYFRVHFKYFIPRKRENISNTLILQDEVERDLIEEINARTKFPITKQDSYANAIYHGAKKVKNVRKQGEGCLKLVANFYKDLYQPCSISLQFMILIF